MKVDLHWYGPDSAELVVVFVHGYGVKWPSKELFTTIAEKLAQSDIASVLFDLSDYDDHGNATFLPLTDQQNRIRSVFDEVGRKYPGSKNALIAHSMGVGVSATLVTELGNRLARFIALAPAVSSPGPRIREGMLKRDDAHEDDQGTIHFKRKDGTTSTFDYRYVQEFSINFDEVYASALPRLGDKLTLILADEDKRSLEQQLLFEQNGAITIPGSDHNFSGTHRHKLTLSIRDKLVKLL